MDTSPHILIHGEDESLGPVSLKDRWRRGTYTQSRREGQAVFGEVNLGRGLESVAPGAVIMQVEFPAFMSNCLFSHLPVFIIVEKY